MTDCPFLKKMRWKPSQHINVAFPPNGFMEQIDVPASFGQVIVQENFMLVFVRNLESLESLKPALEKLDLTNDVLWIAYPKKSSKLASDLSRDVVWNSLRGIALTGVSLISIDQDWSAARYKPESAVKHSDKGSMNVPADLQKLLQGDDKARTFFYSLSATNRKEYIQWITGAKKTDTRDRRLSQILDRLHQGLKNPSEKLV